MIIHGGIDYEEHFLSDSWTLHLNSYKWDKFEAKGSPLGALAYHSCAVVIPSERLNHKNYELYKSSEVPISRSSFNKVKIEGVYFFGGIDQFNNNYSDIKILKVGKRPCEWITPRIDGRPPKPRNSACLVFYEDINLLILHGGKNLNNLYSEVFSDIWVLDLEKMIWYLAKTEGEKIKRSNFTMGIIKNQLLIFGGMNEFSLIGSDVLNINVDLVTKYEEKQQERKNQLLLKEEMNKKKRNKNSKSKYSK